MHILAPHISCVVAPHELADAIQQGFKEIYIITVKGTFKHHVLRGENRHITLKVDSIPGYTETAITESVNFLPAGKIPFTLYEQILGFFRKVMEVKNAEVEAMIHILYNPEQGYHLGVPPQTISKASVNYDWSYIPAGTSIIVDIHSHNTMGAFFSGTDDRDDGNNISFSGVFGKLKDEVPMTVWRFNYYGKKFQAEVKDMFEQPARPETEIPAEWLDQVKIATYSGYQGYQGRALGSHVGGHSNQGNVGGNRHPTSLTGTNSRNPFPVSNPNQDLNQSGKWRYDPKTQNQASAPVALNNGYFPSLDEDDTLTSTFFGNGDRDFTGYHYNPQKGIWVPDAEPADPDFGVTSLLEDPQPVDLDEVDSLGKQSGEPVNSTNLPDDPIYEGIASIYGIEVADAWWSIGNEMSILDQSPELMEELMADMLKLTSEEDQYKIISTLFDRLSEKNQEKIQTNGFA